MYSLRPWKMKSQALVAAGLMLAAGAAGAQSQPQGPVPSPKGDGSTMTPMRRSTHEDRMKAALRAQDRKKAQEAASKKAGPSAMIRPGHGASPSGMTGSVAKAILEMAMAQIPAPDLYGEPNYALSKLPTATCSVATTVQCSKDADCPGYAPPFLVGANTFPGGETCTGPVVPGTGIQKFVDPLPGLCASGVTPAANCIPVAVPDKTTFPGEDYYEIGLRDYVQRFHRDLPGGAKVRGYYQKNTTDPAASQNHYLGPIIIGVQGVPVRVKFVNELGSAAAPDTRVPGPGQDGSLFIPVDKDISGTGLGPQGPAAGLFTENRATIHLHGGNTPWISDGTQHQWTVPATEGSVYKRGLSARDVPDMWFDASGKLLPASSGCQGRVTCTAPGATNNPGAGALTFYYPNQQSSRLMFYHDHAYGITRLNVYAGEAAGFVLTDAAEQQLIATNLLPGIGIPLVLQDKTFVPPAAQLAWQDKTWNPAKWGGEDSLWYPHVYIPNQWPGNPDLSSTNAYGRWDYGPWFHPVQSQLIGVDWQGVASQRPLLQSCTSKAAITAANPTGATDCPTTPAVSLVPESFFDTPIVNGTAYPRVSVPAGPVRFRMLNAAQERNLNLSWFVADSTGTEVSMVDAIPHSMTSTPKLCTPSAVRDVTTGLPIGCWPAEWPADARQGGVPDPTTAGPQWIQVGSESGFLPAPALIPAMPVGYETNKRNVVVLNVANKGLFMGPAERADVIVDFSKYSGKTLILYNDAPAPVPAGDPRQDYFTGAPDLTLTGGAPTTLPGYGPNMRTVMQVYVDPALAAAPPVDLLALGTALKSTFVATQLVPIVPEKVFDKMYPTPLNPTGAIAANTSFGIGTLSATFTPVGSDTPLALTFGNKALHELFTTDFGRMNSLLGVEIPQTNWLNQTTIPFANYDPTTDFIIDGQPQVWKITHNGVDTHTIHFHLLNVQIVNRVGWDGQVRFPDGNELGWKESVRMNPLEDIFVALQPYRQTLPWPMADMTRPLDVDRCVDGSPLPGGGTCTGNSQFTGVDIYNQPITVKNQPVNLGWEYVWHCHLLGHEEEDMLRAEVFVAAPEAPGALTATETVAGPNAVQVSLSWVDQSLSALAFDIQRSPAFPTPVSVGAPSTTFVDTSAVPGTVYTYQVRASKTLTSQAVTTSATLGSPLQTFTAASAWIPLVPVVVTPTYLAAVAPASLTFPARLVGTTSPALFATLTNTSTGPVAISGVATTGDFARNGGTCGANVGPGTSCTIGVTFTPAVGPSGARTGTLGITTNATNGVGGTGLFRVTLTGTATNQLLLLSPASVAFSSTVNARTAVQLVTVRNNTSPGAAVVGIARSITGTNANQFAISNADTTCRATLAAGATCVIGVTFRPTSIAPNPKGATLSVSFTGAGSPQTVSLTGTVLYPILRLPASLAFPSQAINTISAVNAVTVTNAGSATMTINGISLGGANPNRFRIASNNCGPTLAAGASCTVGITFRPNRAGDSTATLNVNVAAPAASGSVALSGTGI
jgi:FtsP/CotA-like multicopper oxidase with cupredoxin domain